MRSFIGTEAVGLNGVLDCVDVSGDIATFVHCGDLMQQT